MADDRGLTIEVISFILGTRTAASHRVLQQIDQFFLDSLDRNHIF